MPGADLSLASRSLALDLRRRRWATDLIRSLGLAPAIFPQIRPCGARLGSVTNKAAGATGLDTGCVVGVARHDHITGALAAGALARGVLLDSMGSAEGLTLALPASTAEPELLRRGYSQGVVEVERRSPTCSGASRPRARPSSGFAACSAASSRTAS